MRPFKFAAMLLLGMGAVYCAEVSINPASPDAASRLSEALRAKSAVIRILPGVIAGTFEVAGSAIITGAAEDPAKVVLRANAAGKAVVTVGDNHTLKITGVTFGAETALEGTAGIEVSKNGRLEAVSCRFEGPLARGAAGKEADLALNKCVFSRVKGDGVVIEGGKAVISDCEFSDTEGAGVRAGNAATVTSNSKIAYAGKSGIVVTGGDAAVTGCTFENCAPTAVEAGDAARVVVADCTVKNTTEDGIFVHNCKDATVSGNHCEGAGAACIRIQGAALATKNVVRGDDKGVGIRINGDGAKVIENRVDHMSYGIGIRNAAGSIIEANQVRWCATGIAAIDVAAVFLKRNIVETSTGSCILLQNSKDCRAEENTVSAGARGIMADGSSAIITRNTAKGCKETAIKAQKGASGEISYNTVSGENAGGIYVENSKVNVFGNTVRGLRIALRSVSGVSIYENYLAEQVADQALLLEKASSVKVFKNKIGMGQYPGICLHGSTDSEVYENEITGRKGHGIHVEGAWNMNVHDNRIWECKDSGIFAERMKTVNCFRNLIHKTGIAIRYNESSGEVYENICHDNDQGIVFLENSEVLSRHNEVYRTNSEGILYRGSHGETYHNRLHHNEWGYYLKSSRGKKIIVHDNDLHDNTRDGIRAEWSADCEIYHNRIVNNQQCGIRIRPKCLMNIYENFIADNGRFGVRAWEENDVKLARNVIVRNGYSGIACGKNNSFVASRNTIMDNGSGGVWAFGDGAIILEENIIYRNHLTAINTQPTGKEGEDITGTGTASIRRNIIYWNGEHDETSWPGVQDAGENIFKDPMLVEPDRDVYTPMAGSPAIAVQGIIGAIPADGKTDIPFSAIAGAGPQQKAMPATPGEGTPWAAGDELAF